MAQTVMAWMSTSATTFGLWGSRSAEGASVETMLLKVPEVAARLGVSRAKVYELMASGRLRSVRVDGSRRVRTADLIDFVAELGACWPTHVCSRGGNTVSSP